MATLGEKVQNSCFPFGDPHQQLLAAILIVLGLFAILEYGVRLITLVSKLSHGPLMYKKLGSNVAPSNAIDATSDNQNQIGWEINISHLWMNSAPLLKKIYDSFFKKGGRLLKTIKVLSSNKQLWKDSVLLRSRKRVSNLRFRCIVDPVKVTVKMGNPQESKDCCSQAGRKSKAYYYGECSSRHDTDDKKASWYRGQQERQSSQCSSHLSGTETPQPACPAGSVASWVRFSFRAPDQAAEVGTSTAHYGVHARNHQRPTGDKQHSSEAAAEGSQGQRFLQHPVGLNTEELGPRPSEQPHGHLNHQASETHFIPSPILSGPRRVVYSAMASDTASRTHLNGEDYAYPHSPRGPQHRLGLEWHPHLPAAQQAEVYVYLVSPLLPSPEHNPEQLDHPFSAPQTLSGKDALTNRMSLSRNRGSTSPGPAAQGSSDTHKQRKSIWERKHQKRSLQTTADYEKLAGSSGGGAGVAHPELLSHNPSALADRARGGFDIISPNMAS
ncbi:Collagen alpha-1(XVIII) chain [Varanus komodoensis]|nr:Collagen alpha-1(XVIII) chain [Varanus komodoensis]